MATMQEIAKHFNVSIQGMTDYVKKHLDEINVDGEHASIKAGKWMFDESAVRRLEEMRGWGIAGVMEAVESQKVKDLEIMVDNLQTALLGAQQETNKALKAVAEAERERRLLAEASISEKEELAILRERTALQADRLNELEQLKKDKDELETAVVELVRRNDELERKLRPWWKRLFE